jgi:hypothetical protein
MSEIHVQASFNSGEWAPSLRARVDLQKYHSGAALLQNFFVDYRGGASTRAGTAYVIRGYNDSKTIRLISFQAAFNVGYCLEFGDYYMRPLYQGSPILETSFAISGATQANPCVLTIVGNNYNTGDWIFVANVLGMTQLNGQYFSVINVAGNLVTIGDLSGNAINSTTYGAYTSGGTAARIYEIASPFAAADLALVKFAQNITFMVLCHPNYPAQVLTSNGATSWTFAPLTIGATVAAPTGVAVTTTLAAGTANYSYVVTSVDQYGQESDASAPAGLTAKQDLRSVAGTNQIAWTAAAAVSYNVYKTSISYFGAVPNGLSYGFIGNCTQTSFIDDNIGANFSISPPTASNPFIGGILTSVTVTGTASTYSSVPTPTLTGGSPVVAAQITAALKINGSIVTGLSRLGYSVGNSISFPYGIVLIVSSINGSSQITGYQPVTFPGSNAGYLGSGSAPSSLTSIDGSYSIINVAWILRSISIVSAGYGYSSAPTVGGIGASTAVTTVSPLGLTNPEVPSFFQQRLVLGATSKAPQSLWLSKSGSYFNFDVSLISQANDSISETLVSGTLNTIKSIVSSASGMLVLTDKGSWMLNGGSAGSAVTPSAIVANPQSFVGANDVPPIVANYDVLYVQSKGSGIRDLAFNIYFSVFTGTDISILSSHLFFGYNILEWAWAELPFYTVWAIRNDGVMLSLAFLKEQDFVAWAQHNTQGQFMSVCTVTEATTNAGNVDAVYVVVQRVINGQTVKYIERMSERVFPLGATSAWCVDAGLRYNSAPATTFTGANHLAGMTVTGLADGNVITPFIMPANGTFTLPTAASVVTIGLGYTCNLQTLPLDVGEPTVQGKVKKIPAVDVRVNDTLGLAIGSNFSNLVPMKDLVVGNVSSMLTGQPNQVVSGLVSGDARTFLDPTYTVPGQYCIQQSQPLPASILGVFPSIVIGDTK